MITVKQVLENYDILTEKADNDSKNLVALVHAGLLDESQLPILRRAMSKPAINMTEAEKKALHGLVESVSSCIISEKQDYLSKLDTSRSMGYPPEKDIPAVIILKRKAIRVYPDNQKVALYYSQALDRYISIPYGKNSKALDMTLNEERLDEISQKTDTKPYVRRTQKRIIESKPKPMMKESFRKKLEQKRQERQLDEAFPLAGAAISSALNVGGKVLSSPAGQAAIGTATSIGSKVAGKAKDIISKVFSKKSSSKAQDRIKTRDQRRLERQKARERRTGKDRDKGGLRYSDTDINIGGGGSGGGSDEPLFKPTERTAPEFSGSPRLSDTTKVSTEKPTFTSGTARDWAKQAQYYNQPVRESNNLNIMKQMVEQNIPKYTIHINETPITINNRVAKKVVNVYESLNRQNKKKVEKMLNEDATSFKKIINFSVRQ